jgi:hypothetical protein
MMAEEGLTRAAYYQVRDYYVDPATFARILSPPNIAGFVRNFNVLPTCLGLWDTHGRMRPTYYAFKIMAQVRGKRWNISTADPQLFGMAAEGETGLDIVFWNFAPEGKAQPLDLSVRLGEPFGKRYKLIRLNPSSCVNNLEIERGGKTSELPDPLQLRLEPYGIRWLTIER